MIQPSLSVEELMKPRYKVIALWPGSSKNIIITDIFMKVTDGYKSKIGVWLLDESVESYPHLFSKLQWWEERGVNEVPQYVKSKHRGEVFKVLDPVCNRREFGHEDNTIEHR